MAKIRLSRALLLRKQAAEKVRDLKSIKEMDIYKVKTQRRAAHEGVDDVIAAVPMLSIDQVTRRYDQTARAQRELDDAIQHANHTIEIEVPDNVVGLMDGDIDEPAPKREDD